MENAIILEQLPVIKHKLMEVGANVAKRISELDLEKQIATIENVKSMKDLRAELNKELKEFEEQRGVVKKAINAPYNEFETIYKTEITERYNTAVTTLKNKIDFVEEQIKTSKKNNVVAYFNELCVSESIDFVKFEKLGIEINLSTTEKKYKEQVFDFIQKVKDDLALISTTEFQVETLTEYKIDLNVSRAITTVKSRKEAEKAEQARIKANLILSRKKLLESIGMNFVEITNSYEYNDDITVSIEQIENDDAETFTAKLATIQAKIQEFKESQIIEVEVEDVPQVAPAVFAPKVETVEEIKTAQFEVKAPLSKLRALGEYMKSNGIVYKNI